MSIANLRQKGVGNILNYSQPFFALPLNTAQADAGANLTAAIVVQGAITITPTAARVLTLPTALACVVLTGNNTYFEFTLINAAAVTDPPTLIVSFAPDAASPNTTFGLSPGIPGSTVALAIPGGSSYTYRCYLTGTAAAPIWTAY